MKKIYYPMLAKDATKIIYEDGKKVKITCEKFGDKNYIGEIKYDGSRYILQWDEKGKAHLTSRNCSVKDNLPCDKTENLRGYLFDDCKELAGIAIDGEILVKINGEFVKNNGSSEVNKIMLSAPDKAKERLKEEGLELVYVVYDILQYAEESLISEALMIRKGYLAPVLNIINEYLPLYREQFVPSETFVPSEQELERVLALGHEGMMLKHKGSLYEQGEHSKHWLKVKKMLTEDGIIMGGNIGTGKYKGTLGALVIGQFLDVTGKTKWNKTPILIDKKDKELFIWENTLCYFDKEKLFELKEVCTIGGMNDELRRHFWNRIKVFLDMGDAIEDKDGNIRINADTIHGSQAVEFLAQEKTQARYRHPRFLQIRGDKPLVDCIF